MRAPAGYTLSIYPDELETQARRYFPYAGTRIAGETPLIENF